MLPDHLFKVIIAPYEGISNPIKEGQMEEQIVERWIVVFIERMIRL